MPYKSRDARLAYGKNYRENVLTKEGVQSYNKEYGNNNYAKISLNKKSYVKENKEFVKATKKKYFDKAKEVVKTKLLAMYGDRCVCCGE
jgi:hypothetical protein